ncbi:MAG: radical SAM family heme chaperone HemW [Nitrospirae bacterium]|nr:radical SAM family heme chaperone HemW [Nitrospirota bacterium]
MITALYIHIPFCARKCSYCDFNSVSVGLQNQSERLFKDYLRSLADEMTIWQDISGGLKTIYIGGGTPTILSVEDITWLLNKVRDNFLVRADAEVTIESNPLTITKSKAEGLLRAGVNRISIGAQSFIDQELALLGRSHNADDALNAYKYARDAGFQNISIDLIYGIPGQTVSDWECSLRSVMELSPEHISAYELTPEINTPLYNDIIDGKLHIPAEEAVIEMYYRGVDRLEGDGYVHYEISNFSKPNLKCFHNLNYWERGEYIGIGAGAHSFINKQRQTRTGNVRDIERYMDIIASGKKPVDEEHEITDIEALREVIFLGLRKRDGIDISLLNIKDDELKKAVNKSMLHGLVEINYNRLMLTRKGLALSNEIIVEILLYIDRSFL